MWELNHKEGWTPKNWCFWTVLLEKTLESPLDCKKIQPVYPRGDQSWVFIGRTDVEAEAPIVWPPDNAKSRLIGKDPDTRKGWRQKEKRVVKEINPEYSLEVLMLKLKLQYFGHLMQRADSLEKTLMLGKIEGGRRSGQQRMRWLDSITDSLGMNLSKLWE